MIGNGIRRRHVVGFTWLLFVMTFSAIAAGQAKDDASMGDLAGKIPASTNAIVAVDVKAALQSAYAQAWGWTADGGSKMGTNPFARLNGVDRCLAAARFNFGTMDTSWETALMQRTDPKQALPGMAVDKLAGKPTSRGPGGLLLVDLGDNTIAAVQDSDRQLAGQWIEQRAALGKASEYLQQAAAKATASTPIVVAFDLKDVVSTPEAMQMLQGDPPEGLGEVSEGDLGELAALFASIKGITLTIGAEKEPRGEATVNFGKDTSKLGANAKPVLLDLLGRQGMAIADFKNWDFQPSGDRVVATGTFSTGGVKRVMRTIRTPMHPAPKSAAQVAAAKSGDPADKSAASRRYFTAISSTIDELKPGKSLAETSRWLVRDAKEIDAMPLLGVDPELVAWGGHVSATLRDIAGTQATGQRQITAQTASQSAPGGHYAGDSVSEADQAWAETQTRVDWANYSRQRVAAAQAVRAPITEQCGKMLQDLTKSRNDIRAAMTQKYNTEF
jgi:hypothetical protein